MVYSKPLGGKLRIVKLVRKMKKKIGSFTWAVLYKSPWWFLESLEPIGLSVQEKKRKIDFQDGGHLGFPIGTILAIFDLQVTPMLPTKYQVNWPRGVGGVGF